MKQFLEIATSNYNYCLNKGEYERAEYWRRDIEWAEYMIEHLGAR